MDASHAVASWSGSDTQMALPVPTADISVGLSGHPCRSTPSLNFNGHLGVLYHVSPAPVHVFFLNKQNTVPAHFKPMEIVKAYYRRPQVCPVG